MKKIYISIVLLLCLLSNICSTAFASTANDGMYLAKKDGLVKSVNLQNHVVYVDGYFWSQIPYDTKQSLVYCFAAYMQEKAKGKFVNIKDFNSGESYAQMSALGISKINR